MHHFLVRLNGYSESKIAKYKMAAKSKMDVPSSNQNISASFQPIWVKICVRRLQVRTNRYPDSKMAKSKMAKSKMVAKSKMAALSSNPIISAIFQPIWIKMSRSGLIDIQNPIWPNPRWRRPLQIKNLNLSQFSTDLDQNLCAPPLGQD